MCRCGVIRHQEWRQPQNASISSRPISKPSSRLGNDSFEWRSPPNGDLVQGIAPSTRIDVGLLLASLSHTALGHGNCRHLFRRQASVAKSRQCLLLGCIQTHKCPNAILRTGPFETGRVES
ncbi:unnamed protein product [Protopolystoma xenopodis]|uniref:Uncharacterized protein n=1 Tax=Protopolystoma xenopodis TaxID=117903 RepID=A0A3S5BJF4_9PLAT|nr:unnamed protein product [Protopolystoma xenopodis]